MLRWPFGAQGSSASYMFPHIMKKLGHAVLAVSPSYLSYEENAYRQVFQSSELKLITLPVRAPFRNKVTFLMRVIRKFRPDIVHVFFDDKGFLYPFFFRVCNPKGKVRWILDIRSPEIRPRNQSWHSEVIKRSRQLFFDAIFTHEKHSAISRVGKTCKPIYIVPPGVDTNSITPKEIGRSSEIIKIRRFIYIGSLSEKRQLAILINAIDIASRKSNVNIPFSVDFYGSGDDEDRLRALSRSLGLTSIVRFKGVVSQQELYKILPTYDAGFSFIPSENYFHAPALKTLEYIAASLFVIGSDIEGNRKFISNRRSGLLVKNTPDDFARAILESVTEGLPNYFRIYSRKNLKLYDWNTIVENKLLRFYMKVINEQ